MPDLIGWIPLLPLLGFLLLTSAPLVSSREMPEKATAAIGVTSVGLAALLTATISTQFFHDPTTVYQASFGPWLQVGELSLGFNFRVDWLTLVMLGVISGVGSLIHLYSAGYMRKDPGYRRYFAYLNLFVGAMLILVLADNLVLLYLGWEGVGLCSYLLIGFWYKDPANGAAARKAFIVTRIGDTAMAIGLFLLFREFATLNIQGVLAASSAPQVSETTITIAALLLLGGAVGKSAQLPLQTWLPDAMAGPTPVSALIHAATMVTAGVYLIARMHSLFALSGLAMIVVATVGALTLLLAGCSALMQTDIKRVLAYSTISQIGYMFLALGVGAWSGAIFHLMTHAFFKALLFLSAGSVILSLHHEQNIFAMGGLRKRIPFTFVCFTIGCACLAALPFTSGFYSKDQILLQAWNQFHGFNWIWLSGVVGALVTGVYSFRLLFLVFFGNEGTATARCKDANTNVMILPLLFLSVLALLGGLLVPPLQAVFGESTTGHPQAWVEWIAIAAPIIGIALAWKLYLQRPAKEPQSNIGRWWLNGWGFDQLYESLLVKPFLWLSHGNRNDLVDKIYQGVAITSRQLHMQASTSQTGQIRWYMTTLVAGSILFLALLVAL